MGLSRLVALARRGRGNGSGRDGGVVVGGGGGGHFAGEQRGKGLLGTEEVGEETSAEHATVREGVRVNGFL